MAKSKKKKRADKAKDLTSAAKKSLAKQVAHVAEQQKAAETVMAAAGRVSDLLRLAPGPVDMSALDARATAGYPGAGKEDARALTDSMASRLSDLQERLYAEGRADASKAKRVLMVLQGIDTSGKGGVIRHAIGLVDPQGVHLKAFKAPTAEELSHHFLWRIKRELPGPGMIGIFDRSHYEDVLIGRVEKLATPRVLASRYDQINRFEAEVAEQGITLIKCFLHVSKDEQLARLNERLDNPEKYWKYNPGDVDVRAKWDAYQEAYGLALEKCSTESAPWYVIPADRKWYRNWAAAKLLLEHLEALDPQWPGADFDLAAEKKRLNSQG